MSKCPAHIFVALFCSRLMFTCTCLCGEYQMKRMWCDLFVISPLCVREKLVRSKPLILSPCGPSLLWSSGLMIPRLFSSQGQFVSNLWHVPFFLKNSLTHSNNSPSWSQKLVWPKKTGCWTGLSRSNHSLYQKKRPCPITSFVKVTNLVAWGPMQAGCCDLTHNLLHVTFQDLFSEPQ